MKVPLLDLKAQYAQYKDEVMAAIADVCDSQMVCLGPAVAQFEKDMAQYCGCEHAIGVSSGTDALLLSLMALEIKPGDEVITTPFTFFATAGVIARIGAKPVFVDVDPDSFNIKPELIEQAITEKTKAIIPVHLYGQPAPMKPICKIAQKHGIAVIEDGAQAIGAVQDGVKCGNFGDFGCFSFYPTKNLGAFGDAGLVTTNNAELAEKAKLLRVHGQISLYCYRTVGGNFRMDAIQGAVLSVKLKHLDKWNQQRRDNAAIYDEIFAGTAVQAPTIEPCNTSIYHQYTIKVPRRDELHKWLGDNEIGSAVFYPKPLHLQDCFADLGYSAGDFPVAEQVAKQVLSLPIYAELTQEQIEHVAKTVLKFYQ